MRRRLGGEGPPRREVRARGRQRRVGGFADGEVGVWELGGGREGRRGAGREPGAGGGGGGGRSAGPAPKSRWKSLGSGLRAQRLTRGSRGHAAGTAGTRRQGPSDRGDRDQPTHPQLLDSPGAPSRRRP